MNTADKRFEIINRPQQDSADIWIYENIGEGMGGISAAKFVESLKPIRNAQKLHVYVNSMGGNVFDGIAIHNSLKRLSGHKTVHVDGLAASIASVIVMAGDDIVMADNALMMIHDPWTMAAGSSADLRSMADELDRVRDVIANTYARRSTLANIDEIKDMMANETWFDAQSAVNHGLADRTAAAKPMAAWIDWSRFKNPPVVANVSRETSAPRLTALKSRLEMMRAVVTNQRNFRR